MEAPLPCVITLLPAVSAYHGFFPEFTVHPGNFVLVHLVEFWVDFFLCINNVLLQDLLWDGFYAVSIWEDNLLGVSVRNVPAVGVMFDVTADDKPSQHLVLQRVIEEGTGNEIMSFRSPKR